MTGFAPPREHPLRRHLVWALVALAYLSIAPYFPRLNNPNENVRVWMTRAIVEDGTLNIDATVRAWGFVDDKAASGGHLYSSKAPGTSLLGVPVLWVQTRLWHAAGWPSPSQRAATLALRFASVMPCLLLFLFAFARWVERRTGDPAARDLLVTAVGLGSIIYPYGVLFVGHAQGAAAVFGAFMALTWDDDGPGVVTPPRRLVAAGALAGAAVLFEYQLLLAALVLAGFVVWRHRAGFRWFALGALPLAIALGAYHTALFGRPWTFPYGHLENQTYARVDHGSGFFGLSRPHAAALGASLFSISYGLFAFSPFLVVGLAGAVQRAWQRRGDAMVCLLVAVVLALFLAGMTHWRAGWCVGPRYIAGVAPFLAAGIALAWRDAQGRRLTSPLRVTLGALVVVSVFLNGLSAATYPHYPEVFDNPVFDLTLPLWRDGYVPSGLGHALGLSGALALVPVAALWLAALTVALVAGTRGVRGALVRAGGAALMALLLLVALSRYGRRPTTAEAHATSAVRSLWDPPGPRRP